MKDKFYLVRTGILCLFLVLVLSLTLTMQSGSSIGKNIHFKSEDPQTSGDPNRELIEEIIDIRMNNFSEEGYFPQFYEANLQSIYFALHALDTLDRLNTIDKTSLANIIMSYYSDIEQYFLDSYALRYLDTDFTLVYYPLTTLLEVNCYAILSLNLLDKLDLINPSAFISFIWSCYQPYTSGFIGQPYDTGLASEFKIATMDNTYYAVSTLDLFLSSWDAYQTEVSELINFINNLQETEPPYGFNNDLNDMFYSLEIIPQTEPTIFSSYYCIKTLEIFGPGAISSIRVNDFLTYLYELYDEEYHYFDYTPNSFYRICNISNIVATALGLELADIYNLSNISRTEVLSFIFSHRTYMKGWQSSTDLSYHELIDSFQILRSLNNLGEISQLSTGEKDQLAEYISSYETFNGFSPICHEYMSTTYFADTIEILSLYNEILNFDLEAIYTDLKRSIFYSAPENCEEFFGICHMEYIDTVDGNLLLRSFPIEYWTHGNHDYINELNHQASWRSNFEILSVFKNIYKLEDFAMEMQTDFSNLISKIISTQFLDPSVQYSAYYGGFLPYLYCLNYETGTQIKYMNFEHTYYALRTLELLNDYLDLGELRDIGFDVNAFETHITRHLVENSTELYFEPIYEKSMDSILQNTYYMVYCLNALNDFSLPTYKIRNFIESNLDYGNMHNIYYSYKLVELLDLEINFDLAQTQALVAALYSEEYYDFYRSTEKTIIDQRIFYYICDIAKFSPMNMKTTFPDTIALGKTFSMGVEFGNLVVADYGIYTSVRFESSNLGTIVLERLDNNTYEKSDIFIPTEVANYPEINGNISIYDGLTLKASFPIVINTYYERSITISEQELSNGIRINVEGSYLFGSGIEPLYDCEIFADVFRNGLKTGTIYFTGEDFTTISKFILTYNPLKGGEYEFSLYLEDPFQFEPVLLGNVTYFYLSPVPGENDIPSTYQADIALSIPLVIGCISVPLGVIGFTSRNKLKKKIS